MKKTEGKKLFTPDNKTEKGSGIYLFSKEPQGIFLLFLLHGDRC